MEYAERRRRLKRVRDALDRAAARADKLRAAREELVKAVEDAASFEVRAPRRRAHANAGPRLLAPARACSRPSRADPTQHSSRPADAQPTAPRSTRSGSRCARATRRWAGWSGRGRRAWTPPRCASEGARARGWRRARVAASALMTPSHPFAVPCLVIPPPSLPSPAVVWQRRPSRRRCPRTRAPTTRGASWRCCRRQSRCARWIERAGCEPPSAYRARRRAR